MYLTGNHSFLRGRCKLIYFLIKCKWFYNINISNISATARSLKQYSNRFCHLDNAGQILRNVLSKEIESIKLAGTWKNERLITSPQHMTITVQGRQEKILNFCANNYLGLAVIIHYLPTLYFKNYKNLIFRTIRT